MKKYRLTLKGKIAMYLKDNYNIDCNIANIVIITRDDYKIKYNHQIYEFTQDDLDKSVNIYCSEKY